MKEVLKTYEEATGQKTNFEKSVCMVNNNIPKEEASAISKDMGIKLSESIGQYLGLPANSSRNKKGMFSRLRERVWKVLQGWKSNMFSLGGKKVLIKSIAQAIPIYTMSCFKLPKSLCEEINRTCAWFWWGSSEQSKKAHWMSWSKMCKSKSKGGMGFRDLQTFNQAMLAKLSWRILKYPDNLMAKILKAKLGSNPSLTWRSILWGHSLFEKGIRWKIRNGERISIDEDPWLSGAGSKIPLSVTNEFKGKRVCALLNANGDWNP